MSILRADVPKKLSQDGANLLLNFLSWKYMSSVLDCHLELFDPRSKTQKKSVVMHEVTHVTWGHHIDQSVLSYFLSIFKLEKWMPDHVFICIDQQRLLQVFSVKELINWSSFLPLDVNHKTRKLAKSNSCLLSHDSNVQSVWNFWRSVIEKQKRSQTQRCLLFSRLQKWGQKFVCVLLDLFLDRHLLHLFLPLNF